MGRGVPHLGNGGLEHPPPDGDPSADLLSGHLPHRLFYAVDASQRFWGSAVLWDIPGNLSFDLGCPVYRRQKAAAADERQNQGKRNALNRSE